MEPRGFACSSVLEYLYGAYFMNPEQEQAAEGRILQQHREAKERLARLTAEASRLGELFETLGVALQQRPESVGLSGESQMPVGILQEDRVIVERKVFDADAIKSLTDDIRKELKRRNQAAQRIKKLGG